MITKTHILNEIKRTAVQNGGVPPGRQRFYTETGIKDTDWLGRYWARWSDAVMEAGLEPNLFVTQLDRSLLFEKIVSLIRELGRFPVRAELMLKRQQDSSFPSHKTFARLGPKSRIVASLMAWCQERVGYEDVIRICTSCGVPKGEETSPLRTKDNAEFGCIYLLKSGRYYKVGRSNAVGRRERELAIQLPERSKVVHSIKTDDPCGVELYWHRRFEGRRKNGEWFELTVQDLQAFKRRRFM